MGSGIDWLQPCGEQIPHPHLPLIPKDSGYRRKRPSPAKQQPAAHMSTQGPYKLLPKSSSGALYHRANTCKSIQVTESFPALLLTHSRLASFWPNVSTAEVFERLAGKLKS